MTRCIVLVKDHFFFFIFHPLNGLIMLHNIVAVNGFSLFKIANEYYTMRKGNTYIAFAYISFISQYKGYKFAGRLLCLRTLQTTFIGCSALRGLLVWYRVKWWIHVSFLVTYLLISSKLSQRSESSMRCCFCFTVIKYILKKAFLWLNFDAK